ncbi:hypothetical protein [Calidithermus timidus]|jgi:hypothetical protein|uniref:hypothetical protein n=1 Tax=Calidithermus timidus TaxID=307124 RepID=UPI0003742803|nr:hypothetical protein [Calidithermus timidus]
MSMFDVYAQAWAQLTQAQRLSLLGGSPVVVKGRFTDPDTGAAYGRVVFPPEYAVYLWPGDPLGPYFRRVWRVEVYGYYDSWWTIQSWLIDRRTVPWINCGRNPGTAGGWSRAGANNWGQVLRAGIDERLAQHPGTLFYTLSHSHNAFFNTHTFAADGYEALPCAGAPEELAELPPPPLAPRTCPGLDAPAWNPGPRQSGWWPPCLNPSEPTAEGASQPPQAVEAAAGGVLVLGSRRGLRRGMRGGEDGRISRG